MSGYATNDPVQNVEGVWYRFDIEYCPACGSERTERTRMPGPKPNTWIETHRVEEVYDYCD